MIFTYTVHSVQDFVGVFAAVFLINVKQEISILSKWIN